MKSFMLKEIPKDLGCYYTGKCKELSEYEIQDLEERGIEAIFYWYETGSYEGSGQMIYHKDGKYGTHDMGHCSCYGPIEHLNLVLQYDSLDAILGAGTKEYAKDYEPLVALARENGYK